MSDSSAPTSATVSRTENASQPDMVNEWLSVEAAALRLGISSRSVARRVQNGQLESRVDANGRRTVLICLPAPAQPAAAPAAPVIEAPAARTSVASDGAVEPSQARELAQQAMTVVIRSHEQTMLAAREEMLAARQSSRRAWAAVAVLVLGASITVGIVTHHLTEAAALVNQSQQRVVQAQDQIDRLTAERDRLRDQVVQAKVQEAQAQGQLAGMTIKPTTQPANVAQRVASILFGEQ